MNSRIEGRPSAIGPIESSGKGRFTKGEEHGTSDDAKRRQQQRMGKKAAGKAVPDIEAVSYGSDGLVRGGDEAGQIFDREV
jgi:hypothetical protein